MLFRSSKKPKCATNVRTNIGAPILSQKNSSSLVKTYSFNDLLVALEDLCSYRGLISLQLERVNLDVDVPPLEKVFSDILHCNTQVGTPLNPKIAQISPMTQFHSHLNNILVGKSKTEIIEMFSGKGFELPSLGYIRVKDTSSFSNHPVTIFSSIWTIWMMAVMIFD